MGRKGRRTDPRVYHRLNSTQGPYKYADGRRANNDYSITKDESIWLQDRRFESPTTKIVFLGRYQAEAGCGSRCQ